MSRDRRLQQVKLAIAQPAHNHPRRTTMALLLCLLVIAAGCEQAAESQPDADAARNQATPQRRQAQPKPAINPLRESGTQSVRASQSRSTPADSETDETDSATPPIGGGAKTPQQVFRPSFDHRRFDLQQLASVGIAHYQSRRCDLYTDLPRDQAESLPTVIDRAYATWVDYFGELPPAPDKAPFRVTAFVMHDKDLFLQTGLIPADLPPIINGRHRGLECWLMDQDTDYYRRHLLIHEATHCFMTIIEPQHDPRPVWYLEGMAEVFGTHQNRDQDWSFGVLPQDNDAFPGLGRITLLQQEVAAGRTKSLQDLRTWPAAKFLDRDAYAWTWALCKFLQSHPRWRDAFRQLGQQTTGTSFRRAFGQHLGADLQRLEAEWTEFSHRLIPGYDVEHEAVVWESPSTPAELSVQANRGWQSTGLQVVEGEAVQLTATGRVILGETTRPWVSEPQGITIEYAEDRPLGELQACVYAKDRPDSLLRSLTVGGADQIVADASGLLLLRINDAPDRRADNRGSYVVRFHR